MAVESEVASQVVSMTLDGVRMTAEVASKGLEKVGAVTLALISLINKKQKEHKALSVGEKKLDLMRKSGNALQDFIIPESALKEFKEGANAFRLTYSLIKNKNSGEVIVVGYQSEASRLSRIIEGLQIMDIAPEVTTLESTPVAPDVEVVSTDNPFTEEQISDLFEVLNPSEPDFELNEEETDPFVTERDKSSPSELNSQNYEKENTSTSEHPEKTSFKNHNPSERPSVRKRLNVIVAKQKEQAEKSKELIKDTAQKAKEVHDTISK